MTVSLAKNVPTVAGPAIIPTFFHKTTGESMELVNHEMKNNRLEHFPSILNALKMDTFGVEYRVDLTKKNETRFQDNQPVVMVWDGDKFKYNGKATFDLRNNDLNALSAVLRGMDRGVTTVE